MKTDNKPTNPEPDKKPKDSEIHGGWGVVLEFIAGLFSFWH